jgi:hypothetical protein
MLFQVRREKRGLCHGDGDDLGAAVANRLVMRLHLAEARLTGDSSQVPQKDHQQSSAVKGRKRAGRAVGALEQEIRSSVADLNHFPSMIR